MGKYSEEKVVLKNTQKVLNEAGYYVHAKARGQYKKLKHRTPKEIQKAGLNSFEIKLDYACLQYLAIVRNYIQHKYDINFNFLEYLLYLYPFNAFTIQDFRVLPFKTYRDKHIGMWINDGVIYALFDDLKIKDKNQLYALTPKYQAIVHEFYMYLHQEKTMPEIDKHNPMFEKAKTSNSVFKQAMSVIRMNKITKGRKPFSKQISQMEKKMQGITVDRIKNRSAEVIEKNQKSIDKAKREKKLEEKIKQKKKDYGL